MELKEFIENYREAFGEGAQLPLLFGYSDTPVAQTAKIGGCFFKGLQAAREGTPVDARDGRQLRQKSRDAPCRKTLSEFCKNRQG